MAPVKSRLVPLTRSKTSMTTRSQILDMEADATSKRKAISSPEKIHLKRSAFGDLTNATTKQTQGKTLYDNVASTTKKLANTKLEDYLEPLKDHSKWNYAKGTLKSYAKVVKPSTVFKVKQSEIKVIERKEVKEVGIRAYFIKEKPKPLHKDTEAALDVEAVLPVVKQNLSSCSSLSSTFLTTSTASDSSTSNPESESSLYVTALENDSVFKPDLLAEEASNVDPDKTPERILPNGLENFDAENWRDPFQISIYATDIFNYFKSLEIKFQVGDYMPRQPDLTRGMRAIVVDWMVEVQENFELNHETLYLAVKMLDLFLMKNAVVKDQLQLIAAASVFIACKYDERLPPAVEDFLFICDGAYSQVELMKMEIKIIKAMGFNLGMPLSYRFLRRYARCGKISMATLTLARFILEVSLMDYSFVSESESKVAAAALLLALKMKHSTEWNGTLEYYSGYNVETLKCMVCRLNTMLRKPTPSLMTIRNKYSHKIFFEVAKLPLLEQLNF